jgi:hypothetical protein
MPLTTCTEENQEGSEEILLADRHAVGLEVPLAGLGDEVADRGVDQPGLLDGRYETAAPAERVGCHHVEHELRGFGQSPVRVFQPVGQAEHP